MQPKYISSASLAEHKVCTLNAFSLRECRWRLFFFIDPISFPTKLRIFDAVSNGCELLLLRRCVALFRSYFFLFSHKCNCRNNESKRNYILRKIPSMLIAPHCIFASEFCVHFFSIHYVRNLDWPLAGAQLYWLCAPAPQMQRQNYEVKKAF